MDCEVLVIDEGAEGQFGEEVDEALVDVGSVLLVAWVGRAVHSVLKLKKEVMVLPSWLPRSRWTWSGKLSLSTSTSVITSMQNLPRST